MNPAALIAAAARTSAAQAVAAPGTRPGGEASAVAAAAPAVPR